jgi:hypothetical protein
MSRRVVTAGFRRQVEERECCEYGHAGEREEPHILVTRG